MTTHAIIVGVDGYDDPRWNLGSAVGDATRFYTWATTLGGVDPADATVLLAPAPGARARIPFARATYQAIQDAVDRFAIHSPVIPGDRLYVYFACHGISANVGVGGGPVLVPSDVSDLVRHRKKLYLLDEMIDPLASHGPEEQFFFVDACRDFALDGQLATPATVGGWRPPDGAAPCRQHALYATASGARAFGELGVGVFTDALLAGLRADGPKLGYDATGENLQLEWSELSSYVIERVRGRIARRRGTGVVQEPQTYSRIGAGNAVLRALPIATIRNRRVTIGVQPPAARIDCEVRINRVVGEVIPVGEPHPPELPLPVEFTGLLPSTYRVDITGPDFERASVPLILWREEAHLEVELTPRSKTESVLESFSWEPDTRLEIDAGGLPFLVWDPYGKRVETGGETFYRKVEPGTYQVMVMSPDGPLERIALEVRVGEHTRWRYRARPLEVAPTVAEELARHNIASGPDNYVYAGPLFIPDQTLASLLALAIFAQMFPDASGMHSLQSLGVDYPKVTDTAAAITVIVAFADGRVEPVTVGLMSEQGLAEDAIAPRLSGFPMAAQKTFTVTPGVHTVRISSAVGPVRHVAVTAMREALSVVVMVNTDGRADLQQYALPRHRPVAFLGDDPYQQIERFVRADRAQRLFAANRTADLGEAQTMELVHGKWMDPLFAVVGGYTLLQQGTIERWNIANLNMLRLFDGFPDTHVLAGLMRPEERDARFTDAMARGIPAIADGVRALVAWHRERRAHIPERLAEAYRDLVPGSAWTIWSSPRPRVEVEGDHLGSIPPGWDELTDLEDALVAAARSPSTVARSERAPRPWARVALVSPDAVAPGVILRIHDDGRIEHDCAPMSDGVLLSLEDGKQLEES